MTSRICVCIVLPIESKIQQVAYKGRDEKQKTRRKKTFDPNIAKSSLTSSEPLRRSSDKIGTIQRRLAWPAEVPNALGIPSRRARQQFLANLCCAFLYSHCWYVLHRTASTSGLVVKFLAKPLEFEHCRFGLFNGKPIEFEHTPGQETEAQTTWNKSDTPDFQCGLPPSY
jgi:hypothetical protein